MAESVAVRMRPENFGVPLPLVAVQFDEAIRLWHAYRDNRYFAGVYDAFRWLAALTNVRPVSRDQVLANPRTILDELAIAGAVASGVFAAGEPAAGVPVGEIDPVWARGVERALRWASGRSATGTPPLPWPGGAPPRIRR